MSINMSNGGQVASNTSDVIDLSPPVYMYAYVTILNIVIFVVGVIGNVLVLVVIVRMRVMRTRVNYFLASLSVADLLVLAVCQPSAMLEFYTREQWVLGYFMCKLIPFLEHWTLHASVLTLLLIGFDRYLTICHPQIRTCPKHTWLLLLPVWILSCFTALPFIFFTSLDAGKFVDGSNAEACRTKAYKLPSRIMVTIIFCCTFVLPLLLLIFLYTSVILALRRLSGSDIIAVKENGHADGPRNEVNASSAKSRRQVARMMVAIVVVFFLCLMPFKIFTLWLTFAEEKSLESLGFEPFYNLLSLCRLVTYVNSAGNPVIYTWMSPRFRRAFLVSLPRCRKNVKDRVYYMN
ncbi:QRFP-like peptide receptor [Biomphalaria glabrata]|uniref:QRFP-like peptide receptor n=1 Tax=Biomphalaria glabrata TaxID=6526 RepID=A0A9W2ZDR4_BIOGL|nr:QRFP-like peptide receptor [Biomphalaria glabrata]